MLHSDRFPSGLGRTRPVEFQEPKKPTANYPYLLVPGTLLYHSGTTTTMAKGLNEVAPTAIAEINPADAPELELKTGDWVRLTSRKGITEVEVKVTKRSLPGTIFVPTHFREVPVNALIGYDPVKERGLTYVGIERIDRVDVQRKAGESQASKLKKTVQEIQDKKRRAASESGPGVSGG